MTVQFDLRRRLAVALSLALGLLLAACVISPGKFTSALDLRRDGRFTFTYTGEIYMVGLTKLAEMSKKKGPAVFEPSTCYKDEESTDERPCTAAEIEKQKADWQEEEKARVEKDKRDGEMAKSMFGGIDPSDPKSAEEFAARLRRQTGWKSVTYKGDGLYLVDFAISGRLDHDFTFPTIERFPSANPFVSLIRRADGTVRIDAPGFGPAGNGGISNFAQLAALGAAADQSAKDKDGNKDADLPQIDGTFTLTTDAEILANNTDEGAAAWTTGKKLEWRVTPRTASAPTALVRIDH